MERLIEKQPLPAIIHWNQEHFVVLYKIKKDKQGYTFYIADPDIGLLKYNEKDFKKIGVVQYQAMKIKE